jgi:hypothetical protein
MIINPTQKRLEFERLIKTIGYRDRSPIFTQEDKRKVQTNYICESGSMAIYSYFIPYFNKKSYLYVEFLSHYGEKDLYYRIKFLSSKIIFKEKTRIAEVGWEVIYTKDPAEFSKKERTEILVNFMKKTHNDIKNGFCKIAPRPGDILSANPRGVKIDKGFSKESIRKGTEQRSLFAKKFGFGKVYDDGFCYARYNEELNLIPI